jgi:hypothetical protein
MKNGHPTLEEVMISFNGIKNVSQVPNVLFRRVNAIIEQTGCGREKAAEMIHVALGQRSSVEEVLACLERYEPRKPLPEKLVRTARSRSALSKAV